MIALLIMKPRHTDNAPGQMITLMHPGFASAYDVLYAFTCPDMFIIE